MPLRDWLCKAHGVFESSETAPVCKHGCNGVEPIFLRAPAVRTGQRTKNIDNTLTELAAQFGLSDLSTKNGSVMNSIDNRSKPAHIAASYNNLYGGQPSNGPDLRPRFASPQEAGPMLDGSRGGGALSIRDKTGTGLGDVFHNRMGSRNVDTSMTHITAETSKDDNMKMQSVLQSQEAS